VIVKLILSGPQNSLPNGGKPIHEGFPEVDVPITMRPVDNSQYGNQKLTAISDQLHKLLYFSLVLKISVTED